MIIVTLGLIWEQIQPINRKWDRIDHICVWAIRLSLLVMFVLLPHAIAADDNNQKEVVDSSFFYACSGGKLDQVQAFLAEHPNWIHARTDNGETCLHLTGIYGYHEVTKHLLEQGADPNIRSTFEQGLRMHPLSWNIYGGHIENIELLLQFGANVNLDFDSMGAEPQPVTAMDVTLQLIENEPGDDRFVRLEKILRQNGGKTMEELKSNPKSATDNEL